MTNDWGSQRFNTQPYTPEVHKARVFLVAVKQLSREQSIREHLRTCDGRNVNECAESLSRIPRT